MRSAVESMLRARSVAVVGASVRDDAFGSIVLKQLVDSGYDGRLIAVNPRYESIGGVRCFSSLAQAGDAIDLAVFAIANERLEDALLDAVAAGTRSVAIFGTAHGLASDGVTPLTERLSLIARAAGIAMCGANGMGFFNFRDRLLVCGFPYGLEIVPGTIGLISHSGSVFSAVAKNRRDLRFNYAVSGGQELVTTAADYLRFIVEQPETTVVGCFLETVRDPERFVAALELAEERDVPIVALKIGRSERGREFAQAHSGAMTGVDAAYQAIFERHNVVRVSSLDEMLDTLELLNGRRRPTTVLVAVASDSGGERGLIVDVANDLRLDFAKLSHETTSILGDVLDPELAPTNPLDLWASGVEFERVYETSLTALSCDLATGLTVFAVDLPPASRLNPFYVEIAKRVHAATDKPFAVLGNAATSMDETSIAALRHAGIPVLMGTTTGLSAIKHVLDFQANRRGQAEGTYAHSRVSKVKVKKWRRRLQDLNGSALSDVESKELLDTFGIPVVEDQVVLSKAAAVLAAMEFGWPVVLKTAEKGVPHKSDRGGVVLNVKSVTTVRQAYSALNSTFGPAVAIEPQIVGSGSAELFLGMVNDRQFGPVVSVGFGGLDIEVLRDSVAFIPPIGQEQAEKLLPRLRNFRLLGGTRGRPPVDLGAVASAISAFSILCDELGCDLSEIDVNPLIATKDGVIAVDALIVPMAKCSQDSSRAAARRVET